MYKRWVNILVAVISRALATYGAKWSIGKVQIPARKVFLGKKMQAGSSRSSIDTDKIQRFGIH